MNFQAKIQQFALSIALAYLLIFSFAISILQSVYFLSSGSRSVIIQGLGFFLFLCFLTFFLRDSLFKKRVFEVLVSPYVLFYCTKVETCIKSFSEKYSSTSFFFLHFYLSVGFTHFFFLFFGIDNFLIDSVFYLLNFVKVAFLPPVILRFLFNFSFGFPDLSPLLEKQGVKYAQQALEYLTQFGNLKKNPKTAAAIWGTTLVIAAAEKHSQNVIRVTDKSFHDLAINTKVAPEWVNSDVMGSYEHYKKTMTLYTEIHTGAPLTVMSKDMWAFFSGTQTYREQLQTCLPEYKLFEAQFNALKAKKSAEEFTMSRLAVESFKESGDSVKNSVTPEIASIVEAFIF